MLGECGEALSFDPVFYAFPFWRFKNNSIFDGNRWNGLFKSSKLHFIETISFTLIVLNRFQSHNFSKKISWISPAERAHTQNNSEPAFNESESRQIRIFPSKGYDNWLRFAYHNNFSRFLWIPLLFFRLKQFKYSRKTKYM